MKRRVYLMTAISALAIIMTACGSNSTGSKSSQIASGKASAPAADGYVEKLGEYKGLEYSKADMEVTAEEVDAKIKSFLSNYPEKIMDRPIKNGDTANIDYEGKKDGVPFDGGTDKGYNLNIGSGSFIAGFEEGLIGKKPGETVDLDLTFPKDYHSEELKGAKVVFTVKINYIAGDIPEKLTDELVKANTSFKSAKEYEADIRKNLEESKKEAAENNIISTLIDEVVTKSAINSVPKEEEDKYDNQIKNYWNQLAASNGVELKDFITNQLKTTEEEFNNKIREQANFSAKRLVVVKAIAKAENINVSEDEYKAALNDYYENSGAKGQMELSAYEERVGKDNIMDILLNDKVGKFLMENGKAK